MRLQSALWLFVLILLVFQAVECGKKAKTKAKKNATAKKKAAKRTPFMKSTSVKDDKSCQKACSSNMKCTLAFFVATTSSKVCYLRVLNKKAPAGFTPCPSCSGRISTGGAVFIPDGVKNKRSCQTKIRGIQGKVYRKCVGFIDSSVAARPICVITCQETRFAEDIRCKTCSVFKFGPRWYISTSKHSNETCFKPCGRQKNCRALFDESAKTKICLVSVDIRSLKGKTLKDFDVCKTCKGSVAWNAKIVLKSNMTKRSQKTCKREFLQLRKKKIISRMVSMVPKGEVGQCYYTGVSSKASKRGIGPTECKGCSVRKFVKKRRSKRKPKKSNKAKKKGLKKGKKNKQQKKSKKG